MDATALALAGNVKSSITLEKTTINSLSEYRKLAFIPYGAGSYGLGTAVVGNVLYTFGGRLSSSYYNYVSKYFPKSRTSNINCKQLIYAMHNPACTSVGTDIYVIGGSNASGYVQYIQKYNTLNDTTTAIFMSGVYVYGQVAVTYGTDVYFYNAANSTLRMYSTTLGTQTQLATVPAVSGSSLLALAIKDNIIYATYTNGSLRAYNITTAVWTSKATAISPYTVGPTASTIQNKIYFYDYGVLQIYDIQTDAWTKINYANGYYYVHAAVHEDNIYFACGQGLNISDSVLVKIPVSLLSSSSRSTARHSEIVQAFNNKIYSIGGLTVSPNAISYLTEEYSPITNTITIKAASPISFNSTTDSWEIVDDGIVFQSGTSVRKFNPTTNTWSSLASLVTATSRSTMQRIGDNIYHFGGWLSSTANTNVLRYNITSNTWFATMLNNNSASIPNSSQPYYISSTVYNNKLYIFGGANNTLSSYSDWVYSLNVATENVFVPLNPTGFPRAHSYIHTVGNKAYIIGGYNSIGAYTPTDSPYFIQEYNLETFAVKNGNIPDLSALSASLNNMANVDSKLYFYVQNSVDIETYEFEKTELSGISTLKGYLAST